MSVTLSSDHTRRITNILAQHKDRPGLLMPILHAVQEELGYVPEEAVPLIAETLNITRAEVHGVVTFYHYFRDTPPARHSVQVCRAESCQAAGGDALEAHVKKRLGLDHHQMTADGSFMLEPVYCLGLCACSPAVMVDGEPYGRVSPEKFDQIIHETKRG